MPRWRCHTVGVPDRLTVAEVAGRLRVKPATWRSWVARGVAPKPDGQYDARTPWWWSTTVDHWNDRRPSRRVS